MSHYRINKDGGLQRKMRGKFEQLYCARHCQEECRVDCAAWEVSRSSVLLTRCAEVVVIELKNIEDYFGWLKEEKPNASDD